MAAPSKISIKSSEKISFITNLSTMLSAGIPILEAIDSLLEDTKGNQKKLLETLRRDLVEGKRMHATLANFPRSFDPVTVNLIKAAEEAGTLETTLKDLRTHIQQEMEFVDKVKFALIYPVLILIIFVAVLLMILIFVIPRISSVFTKLKIELPLPTRIMVFVSDIIVKQTEYLLAGLAAAVLFSIILYKKKKSFITRIFLSLPLISGLAKEIDLTRFSRSLFLLLSAGLPITTALDLAKDVVARPQTRQLIIKSREMILSGKRMSDGFKTAKGAIPSIFVKLVEAGEKSGSLDKSMQDISQFLDYQVTNSLKALVAILEPVMLLVVGIFVGGMMMAIIAPIYGLIGKVGAR